MRFIIVCACALILAIPYAKASREEHQRWSIMKCQVEQKATTDDQYITTVEYVDNGGGASETHRLRITFRSYLQHLTSVNIFGNRAIVIGRNDYFGTVVVLDLKRREIEDKLVGYYPTLLGKRWIAFVEWYPNHLYGQYSTDVVLVYDLTRSPVANRPKNFRSDKFSFEWMQYAGVPVYPQPNLAHNSYQNVSEAPDGGWMVVPNTFGLLKAGKLIFVGGKGSQFTDQTRFLVTVPIVIGRAPRELHLKPLSFQELGITSKVGGPVVVAGLQVISGDEVRILFPSNRYGKGSATLNVRDGAN